MPPSIKPTPPLATDCLAVPAGRYAAVPQIPPTLTDAWAVRMWAWANRTLGTATADRVQWQGERDCIREKAAAGAIR